MNRLHTEVHLFFWMNLTRTGREFTGTVGFQAGLSIPFLVKKVVVHPDVQSLLVKSEFCPLVNTRKKLGFAPPSQNVKPEIGWQTWGSWERGAGQDSTPFRDRTAMGKLLWIAMIWAFRWERGIWFIAFPILNSRYDRAMNRFLFELVFLWDLPRKNL